ncbi:unnamed protein product [Rotaria magnacalcarata]|uniref:Uncharacterized protein n=1 Tax=Rotaria magnacalcarata TaxID=392030 RepID=A0A816QTJ4_9BILA|nr:unnamed protein product [Rotaria magnacalcarata]CAF2022203.1 unnamed protein product [Rotaria magnacalcarata]CAF2063041.1 unnamed protein product [Rotaria magnacalcarata]CAF2112370.1 unnamed protein product [Rotaria magnacalcarata]CAF3758390.1 unnamed protein product [Rotaria magnacalcarata]
MNRRFRCGRLVLTRDGTIKKLDLEDGGGTRVCNWDFIDMNFDHVLHRLQHIYRLDEKDCKTSLYDFRRHSLNTNEYNTFLEYIDKHGLNSNSTVIYLCTYQADDNDNPTTILSKNKNTSEIRTTSSTPPNTLKTQQKLCTLTELTPPLTLTENKDVDKDKGKSYQEKNTRTSSVYSFKKSSNDLVNNMHTLIGQIGFDEISIQLFEYICIINGYVCSIIDPLQQNLQHFNTSVKLVNQSEMKLYSDSLNDVSQTFQSVETLINLNKTKFHHIEQFSMVVTSFAEFHYNLKILYKQWFEYVEKHNRSEASSSMLMSSTELVPSIITDAINQVSSEDHHDINVENSERQSSSTQQPFFRGKNEKFALFRPLFSLLTYLLKSLYGKNLQSYYEMVESSIYEIKSVRSNINLSNCDSILHAKQHMLSIRDKYTQKFDENYLNQFTHTIDKQVSQAYDYAMTAIQNLLQSFHEHLVKLENNNQNQESHRLSTSPSVNKHEQYKRKNSMRCTQRNPRNFRISNNRKRLTASHSSTKNRSYRENDRKTFQPSSNRFR